MGEAARVRAADEAQDHEHVVQLPASWADYLRLLAQRGEAGRPRLSFAAGVLEVMSPSEGHEGVAELLGLLVAVYCAELGLEGARALGSVTMKSARKRKGAEADKTFALRAGRGPADLAIEVVWTRDARDKLPIYHALGVREVWVWRAGAIAVHVRGERAYRVAARSRVLPGIDLALLCSCAAEGSLTRALARWRRRGG